MNFLKKIFNKDKQLKKEKIFKFKTWEAVCIGEKYEYEVKALSKEEAFKKLVIYFYGEPNQINKTDIKSKSFEIHYPNRDVEGCTNMPLWFHDVLKQGSKEISVLKLKEFMQKNNIKILDETR